MLDDWFSLDFDNNQLELKHGYKSVDGVTVM